MEYTEEEVNWLKAGVQRFGRVWNQILNEYPFHHTRIAVDLKDKYKRLTVMYTYHCSLVVLYHYIYFP